MEFLTTITLCNYNHKYYNQIFFCQYVFMEKYIFGLNCVNDIIVISVSGEYI